MTLPYESAVIMGLLKTQFEYVKSCYNWRRNPLQYVYTKGARNMFNKLNTLHEVPS